MELSERKADERSIASGSPDDSGPFYVVLTPHGEVVMKFITPGLGDNVDANKLIDARLKVSQNPSIIDQAS